MIPSNPADQTPTPVQIDPWSHAILNQWLTIGAVIAILFQLATWIPHYLTWPYWADHDVFASAAQSWTVGLRPYRDTRLNNFPGTIYLFWILGQVFGWGRPAVFYAADVTLLLGFGATLVFWSQRRTGQVWPGLLGFVVLLSMTLNLDYAHAAQRDWHASACAVLALLVVQAVPGTTGLVLSAALAAVGFSIRPQVILLGPAIFWSAGWLDLERSPLQSVRRVAIWLAWGTGFVVLLFLPLILAGVLGDLREALRLITPGSNYNRTGWLTFAQRWTVQAADCRWWVLATALMVLASRQLPSDRRLGVAWLLALAGTSLYLPISPLTHSYLKIPLQVVGVGALAVVLGWVSDARVGSAALRLIAVLGLAAMGGTSLRPDFCEFGPTIRAFKSIGRPAESRPAKPPGYSLGTIPSEGFYPWDDYQALITYLRTHTSPSTRVANLLKGDPAVVSMVGRVSALPAESITWLRMVRPADQPSFVARLKRETDSVVVWIPDEVGPNGDFSIDLLTEATRRLYEFEVRLGQIEVWRRKVLSN